MFRCEPPRHVAVASTLLVVAFVASDAPGRLSLLVWFTIVPVGFAVAVGLRQAWPVVVGMLVPHALAVGDVFESVWMVPMWAVPTFAAGIVLGLVSDLLSEVAEAAPAHDHERRLRTSVDTAPIGILTVDLDGRTTLVNALITDFIQVDDPPTDLASFARHVHPPTSGCWSRCTKPSVPVAGCGGACVWCTPISACATSA
ncbi:MAG: hypothetical protein R2713_03785 [Ilumatobacteraceae bacterium]